MARYLAPVAVLLLAGVVVLFWWRLPCHLPDAAEQALKRDAELWTRVVACVDRGSTSGGLYPTDEAGRGLGMLDWRQRSLDDGHQAATDSGTSGGNWPAAQGEGTAAGQGLSRGCPHTGHARGTGQSRAARWCAATGCARVLAVPGTRLAMGTIVCNSLRLSGSPPSAGV